MRILVIADVHANLPALLTVLQEEFDKIVCAGDLVDYGPSPNEVVEILREFDPVCVLGNHDWAVITGDYSSFNPFAVWSLGWTRENVGEETVRYISRLPLEVSRRIGGLKIYITHGSPLDPLWDYVFPWDRKKMERIFETRGEDLVVLGHTHIPLLEERDGRILLNPGSVGQPRDGNWRASYAVVDTDEWRVEIVREEYPVERVVERMRELGFPEFLWRRLLEGV